MAPNLITIGTLWCVLAGALLLVLAARKLLRRSDEQRCLLLAILTAGELTGREIEGVAKSKMGRGAMYVQLNFLEERGLVRSRKVYAGNGARAYQLTEGGRRVQMRLAQRQEAV